MGSLKDARGRWLHGDADKVGCLVSEGFGGSGGNRDGEVEGVGRGVCPRSRGEIERSVR